jgi:cytochrome c553
LISGAAQRRGGGIAAIEDRETSDRAVEQLTEILGGREALVAALEIGEGRKEIDQVLGLLADPRYAGMSLRRICSLAGLTIADFFAAFRSATLVRAQVQATAAIAAGLPAVVQDVVRRAAPYQATCTSCHGVVSTDPKAAPCPVCRGAGETTVEPDLDRQKLALEIGEILKKGGGISLTQTNQTMVVGGGAGAGMLERLQQTVSGVMNATPLVIDVAGEGGDAAR